SPVGKSSAQGGSNHLLGGALRVVTRLRSVDDATTGHLRCADRALTGAAGSLLLERLAACTGNFATTLGLVGSLACRSELRDNDLVDQRNVGLNVEQLGGQFDSAGLLALRVENVERCGASCVGHLTTLPSLRYGR